MGRKIEERRADGTKTTWRHLWYGSGDIRGRYVYYVLTSSTAKPSTYVFYDSLGRETTSYYSGFKGKRVRSSLKYYNAKGELYLEAIAHYEGDSR
jgi:hypothetical protein